MPCSRFLTASLSISASAFCTWPQLSWTLQVHEKKVPVDTEQARNLWCTEYLGTCYKIHPMKNKRPRSFQPTPQLNSQVTNISSESATSSNSQGSSVGFEFVNSNTLHSPSLFFKQSRISGNVGLDQCSWWRQLQIRFLNASGHSEHICGRWPSTTSCMIAWWDHPWYGGCPDCQARKLQCQNLHSELNQISLMQCNGHK